MKSKAALLSLVILCGFTEEAKSDADLKRECGGNPQVIEVAGSKVF